MALSDLSVYSEFAYNTSTEVLRQQLNLFNEATNGAILLSDAANEGDYNDAIYWARTSGLVKRRNAYGSGSVTAKKLTMLTDTMVKIAAGTPPIEINPGQFLWIQKNPEEAGVVLGQQLAVEMLADMLNTALGATYAAIQNTSGLKFDATGQTSPADKLTPLNLNSGQALFGDAATQIVVWAMHSKPLYDFYGNALTNAQQLFRYESVGVVADPFGRRFIISDSPGLVTVGAPNVYHTLGLVPGAIQVQKNNDFLANEETKNGDENILRTYQAEWSYELGVKGFSWNKTGGGHSPTDAALMTATNWTKISTSIKDCAGVVIETH